MVPHQRSAAGDAALTTSPERVVNRGSPMIRLARRLRYPADVLMIALPVLAGYLLFTNLYRASPWVPLLILLQAMLVFLLSWASSPAWIDVGPEGVKFQPLLRVIRVPLHAIRDIEVHRHWQSAVMRNRAPDYWIKLRRSNLRGWILYHVQPEAGDRLLYLLHQYEKPILVYNWQ
jgi:hypothetical protein